jgi:hypothetical protein
LGHEADVMPITVQGFISGTGEPAFADDAVPISGVIRITGMTGGASPATTRVEALTGSDRFHCASNKTGNSGIIEILFTDNLIERARGAPP